ncbi:left-right determination factor 2-like isoform X1 [Urocitellus parryii]|uniref:left-right determination factor 2-like isoform X1 n=1 Tax=Urocitellus parryii TaxID=9999 RepID=UPI000E55993C|nr:left-right determination factor 2-like isoform X1 [Urocitellus parryii]
MWSPWLCLALWVMSLVGPGEALTEEQVLDSLLQQLQLSEAPTMDRADVEELTMPPEVQAQYVSLMQRSHGDRSREKRFSPSFREMVGKFLVSEASTQLLVFGMEGRLPPNSELVQAVLRIFQEPVPRATLRKQERPSTRGHRARITIEWLRVRDNGPNRTSLIDSRLVSIHKGGWKTFDVTEAVNFWQQLRRPRQPLMLKVSVLREHLGPGASDAHKLVRFSGQGAQGAEKREPQLELHTLDLKDYGAQGNCDPEAPVTEGTRCCRRQAYLDLEKTKWADNWVVEPPGFLVYECAGSCLQLPERLANKWPFLGPRQCIASETTSLPVIVNIREGGRTRLQVVSLPNMRVQECSCVSDGAPVSTGLQP